MASIYQRQANGSWHIQFRSATGELRQKSLRTRDKKLAQQKLAEITINLQRGGLGLAPSNITNASLMNGFKSEVINKKSPPWARKMRQQLANFEKWLGGRQISKLSITDVETFVRQRRAVVSVKTTNDELILVRRLFRWALERDLLIKNVAACVGRLTPSPHPTRIFTPTEIQAILHHASALLKDYFRLLLLSGCRESEIRFLRWSDVNLQEGYIVIRSRQDWRPKTPMSERLIPLLPEARAIIEARPKRSEYVLSVESGGQMAYPSSGWRRIVARCKKDGLNISDASIHCLRHSFATRALESGVDVSTVAEFLGHSNNSAVTRRYLHIGTAHKLEAAKLIKTDGWF